MNAAVGGWVRAASIVGVVALVMMAPVSAASAQDATAHPAHIHSGTCDKLGDIVAPLQDVAPPEGEHSGSTAALPLETSETIVDVPLQQLLDGQHAINVHKSADQIDVYIACGDIGGVVKTDESGGTEIEVALGQLNDSGYFGVASLGSASGSNQTEVTVTLIEPGEMAASKSTEAQQATPAGAAAVTAATVDMKDIAFHPQTITVPAGGSI